MQDPSPSEEQDLELAIAEIERSLETFKARYYQVKADQLLQHDLQAQLSQSQHDYRQQPTPALKAEIKHIRKRLEDLEIALESQLFSWNGLREIFWQAVRFGGAGIVIGWVLKTLAG